MELKQYIYLMRKWVWLIALGAMAAGGTAFVGTFNMKPIYEASSTLRISSPSLKGITDPSVLQSGERLAQTYAQLLREDPVLDAVIANLALEVDTQELRRNVTIQSVLDTELIRIRVQNTDPSVAQAIANEIPVVFAEQEQTTQASRFASLKTSLRGQLTTLENKIHELQAMIVDRKAQGAVEGDTEIAIMESDLEQARSSFTTLQQNYGSVELAEVQSGSNVIIAVPAKEPKTPLHSDRNKMIMLATMAGAAVSAAVAFLIEYMDDTIKTPNDVKVTLGTVTLGAVARGKNSNGSEVLVAEKSPKSSQAEAYRVLRTNLQFSDIDHPTRSLLVTSAGPTEGKSTTVANLAVVMAQAGQRVVLIDSDLRKPRLHKLFSLPNKQGLTSVLAERTLASDDWLHDTEVENLKVITSGPLPPNPSEVLGSERMQRLVASLKEQADVLLFDSPPVVAVADAAVLAKQVDGTLLVVDSGKTRRGLAQQAQATLKQVGANVLGVVLNKVSYSKGSYYYYNYPYYSHYSDDGHDHPGHRTRHPGIRGAWDRVQRRSKR